MKVEFHDEITLDSVQWHEVYVVTDALNTKVYRRSNIENWRNCGGAYAAAAVAYHDSLPQFTINKYGNITAGARQDTVDYVFLPEELTPGNPRCEAWKKQGDGNAYKLLWKEALAWYAANGPARLTESPYTKKMWARLEKGIVGVGYNGCADAVQAFSLHYLDSKHPDSLHFSSCKNAEIREMWAFAVMYFGPTGLYAGTKTTGTEHCPPTAINKEPRKMWATQHKSEDFILVGYEGCTNAAYRFSHQLMEDGKNPYIKNTCVGLACDLAIAYYWSKKSTESLGSSAPPSDCSARCDLSNPPVGVVTARLSVTPPTSTEESPDGWKYFGFDTRQ